MKQKSVSVTDKQAKYIDERCLNLSRFLQKKLEELMDA